MNNIFNSLKSLNWQLVALLTLPAIALFFGFHWLFEEYDSYIYLSAVRENYVPGLGFGRLYFIKLFSWPLYLFPTNNIPLLTLILKLSNYVLTALAIGLLTRILKQLFQWSYGLSLFFALLVATSVPIAFYSFELVTEPLTFFLLVLCFDFVHRSKMTTTKRMVFLFTLLGVIIHCRESYLLLIPYFFIEWKKKTDESLIIPLGLFAISAVTPFIYQFFHQGSAYFIQVCTALFQTLQFEQQAQRYIIIAIAAIILSIAFVLKKKIAWHFFSKYSWCFVFVPELVHLSSGTLHPFEKPRYYYITTITLAMLSTQLFHFLTNNKVVLLKRAIAVMACLMLMINLGLLMTFHQKTKGLGHDLINFGRLRNWQQTSIALGPLGMMLRATNGDDKNCFRIIENGWNWPKEQLAAKIRQEISYGFEVVIIPSLLTNYQQFDVQQALKNLSSDRYQIIVQANEISIKPTRQHGLFTTIFTNSPYCWN